MTKTANSAWFVGLLRQRPETRWALRFCLEQPHDVSPGVNLNKTNLELSVKYAHKRTIKTKNNVQIQDGENIKPATQTKLRTTQQLKPIGENISRATQKQTAPGEDDPKS